MKVSVPNRPQLHPCRRQKCFVDGSGSNGLYLERKRHCKRRARGRLEKYFCIAQSTVSQQRTSGSQRHESEDGVIIAGAGIAGLATAAALQKVGISATVLERDPGPRLEGSAIGLWPNAFRALDALGVAAPLRDAHPLLQRIELSRTSGALLRHFSLDECKGAPHEFRGVLRGSLLRTLEQSLLPGTVRYSSPIQDFEETSQGPQVRLSNGETLRGRAIVGADGARSLIARNLNLAQTSYAGYSAYRGVAEFDGPLPVRMDTVRQVLGQGDAAPHESQYKEDCLSLVKGWGAGIFEAVQNTPDKGITRNRIGDRWLVPSRPFGRGCITLAGDSAHPMTPNLGQGGCTALEDGVVLAQHLRNSCRQSGSDFAKLPATAVQDALRAYEKKRSLRVTKITVRSNLMGQILGSGFQPVCLARDLVIEKLLPISSFLNHTLYDCGSL